MKISHKKRIKYLRYKIKAIEFVGNDLKFIYQEAASIVEVLINRRKKEILKEIKSITDKEEK